jgi:putative ABC transport system permease protein
MTKNGTKLNLWFFRMAWRDSRTHRRRLVLYMTTIVLGIAALVSISSFGDNMERTIDNQSKMLLGADLMISSIQPFSSAEEVVFDSLSGQQAREIVFASMALFPKTNDSRLVQVRALQGNFPFYGKLGTDPAEAAQSYADGPNVLVDDALLLQFNAEPGDSIRIGVRNYLIKGRLKNLPSEPPVTSTFSPKLYLPIAHLEQPDLLQRGSLVTYRIYFKFTDDIDVQKLVKDLQPFLNKHRLRFETIEKRKQRVGRIMANLNRFLNLVAFIALILGSIGVSSAVHVHTKQKLLNIAIFRCLGARAWPTFLIYLLQASSMSLLGCLVGALLGTGIPYILPAVLQDFLPVPVEIAISWIAILKGVAIGLGFSFLFTLLPLVSVRKTSPLLALRASYENNAEIPKDRLKWAVYISIVAATILFSISQVQEWLMGIYFAAGTIVAFIILAGVAKLIMVLFKRLFPQSWPYVWRQAMANLYRPNNQTLVMMLSVGLGTFLISTLYLSHSTLLQKVTYVAGGDRPNLILFDVQPDQKNKITGLVKQHDLPVLQESPIVTMRISKINHKTVEEMLSDSTQNRSRGLLRWEFRTTYRDFLLESETLTQGEWLGRVDSADTGAIPISFDENQAQRLEIALGDTVIWDVQGIPLTTTIASLRKVDWQRIQANFMVVFPEGALEYAPQFYIIATKAPSTERSAALQREVVRMYPNVSMIDLALVLNTLDDFLEKISFVIRFMALFSVITGLMVLTAAVITSRFQRMHESILLRTLGAQRQQVVRIMLIEYLFLGSLSALTGLVLAYFAGWALAYFVFESVFLPTILPFIVVLCIVTGLTIIIGMMNSRGLLDRPPLEILRAEA